MQSKFYLFFVLILSFSSCNVTDDLNTLTIKVQNTTDYTINNLTINGVTFETKIEPDEYSDVQIFEMATVRDGFMDAHYTANIGEIELKPIHYMICIMPIDEEIKELKRGEHTFEMMVSNSNVDGNPLGLAFKYID